MMRYLFLAGSHGAFLAIGFALGIYLLPILTAPKAPTKVEVETIAVDPVYKTEFKKGQRGNDLFHWGEGELIITDTQIALNGKLAPGPDYKMYLTKKFVEHEDEFLPIKEEALYVADVKTFENFIIPVSKNINFDEYNTVVIWCEAFKEFITSAKYN